METAYAAYHIRVFALLLAGVGLYCLERMPGRKSAHASEGGRVAANLILSFAVIAMRAGFAAIFADALLRLTDGRFGLLHQVAWPAWLESAAAIIILDAFAYWAHRLLHCASPGWRVHRVHHSDWRVDVTTSLRQHPLESVWRYLVQMIGIALSGAAPEAVALYVSLSGLNALFEHANIALPSAIDRWLNLVIVTPNMHKNHHSRDQKFTDSNYGNLLSLWDRLFGTYTNSLERARLHYGLDEYDSTNARSLCHLLRMPFVKS